MTAPRKCQVTFGGQTQDTEIWTGTSVLTIQKLVKLGSPVLAGAQECRPLLSHRTKVSAEKLIISLKIGITICQRRPKSYQKI